MSSTVLAAITARRILVVDDEPDILLTLNAICQSEVIMSKHLITQWKALSHNLQVVIMDLLHPTMT